MPDGVLHIVRDHERGQMVFGDDGVGELEHLGGCRRIEGGGVLVEQEQPGILQRRHEKRQRLPLAAGQQSDLDAHAVLKPEAQRLQPLVEHLALCGRDLPAQAAPSAAPCREGEILFDHHVRGRAGHGVLEHAPQQARALVVGQAGHVLAADDDAAAVDGPGARHRVEKRGLAGAVAADHGDEVAAVQVQLHAVQRAFFVDGAGVEGFADVCDVKHCVRLRSLPRGQTSCASAP